MKFKLVFASLLFVVSLVRSQNPYQHIKQLYSELDSALYIDQVIDQAWLLYGKGLIKKNDYHKQWKKEIMDNKTIFVLNIKVDSVVSDNYIKPDTSEYNYSLISFDNKLNVKNDICFDENIINPFFYEFTGSVYYKKLRKGYKNVLKKNPKYILRSYRLAYTILYMLDDTDDEIYVYHVWSGVTYKLENYLDLLHETKDDYRFKYRHEDFSL